MTRFELKPLPPKEAVGHFRRKGFAVGFSWQDVWEGEHARAFTVAKAMQLDLLSDIRAAVDKAIAKGQSLDQFRKDLTPILQKRGWWGKQLAVDLLTGEQAIVQLGSPRRLKTIYDVNLRTSHAAGNWEKIDRLKERRPFLRYSAVNDNRTRPEHRAWHGTVLPVDDPWWNTHYPPNGWQCRCGVQQLSQRDLDRFGHEVSNEPPPSRDRSFHNKRSGKTITVPEGIDPGFGYNVGKAALKRPVGGAFDVLAQKLEGASPEIARASIADFLGERMFDRHLGGTFQGGFPVAQLGENLAEQLGAKAAVVRASQETILKQAKHRLTPEDYLRLQELFERGEAVADRPGHLVLHAHLEGAWWSAVVKRIKDGGELFLVSIRRSDPASVDRIRKRGQVVREES